MERGGDARGGAGGGEDVQALRPNRPLSLAAALAVVAGLLAYPILATDGLREPLTALAGLALLVLAVGLVGRWGPVVQAGLSLCVAHNAAFLLERGEIDPYAPLYAGGLLVAAELSYDAIEPRGARRSRALTVAALGLAAATVSLIFLGTASLSAGGLLVEIVGVVAAAAALGLLARLIWAAREA